MSLGPPPGRDLRASISLRAPGYVCGYGPHPGCRFVAEVVELSLQEVTIRVEDSVPLQGRVALLLRAEDPHLEQTVAGIIVRAMPSSGGMRYSLRLDGLSLRAEGEIARYIAARVQRPDPDGRPRARPRPPALAPRPPAPKPARGSGFHSAS